MFTGGNLEKIEASDVLDRLGIEPDNYILLSAHREENIDTEKNFTSLFTAINALAIVSDSGTLPEESSFYLSIGHPIAAVCIRTSTERPETLEAGNFILAGITTKELLNATDMAIDMKQRGGLGKPCPDYVDETVSMKVVRIIQGYVNVVNKMVWRKEQ